MRISILTVFTTALIVAPFLFIAYYLMLWPFQPSLEVDDPVISKWLQQDGVVIYRRGEELENSHIYTNKGERTLAGGCRWHSHLSSSASDYRIVISRQLATNHATCESLIEEGNPVE